MKAIWKSIEAWLKENAPRVHDGLKPGAKAKDLTELEKHTDIELPDDVKDSFAVHDGQKSRFPLFKGEFQLLSTDLMAKEWDTMKGLVDDGTFKGNKAKSKGPVKDDWWNVKWLPFASDGSGNLYCLDFDPAKGGKKGQVIVFWHADEKREVLAPSLKDFLEDFLKDLESKKYTFADDEWQYKG